tara:strand:- start:3 stop:374 length:372 start_codon:yes stop_codon:yes gene_type:complete
MEESLNVFDEALIPCGENPLTGFYRDGCCNTGKEDAASHTVCVSVTREFLEFSKGKGNDLTAAVPAFNFPGLLPGDSWCLCAARWLEAYDNGVAPKVYLTRTHKRALEVVKIDQLKEHSIDIN